MILRDAFEVFKNRSSSLFRGVPQTSNGMDAKAWRNMLKDSQLYKTTKGLAKGVLIFSEVTGGSGIRLMDFNTFQEALEKVGSRKGMSGSDISAYICHMASQFHQQAVESGDPKARARGPLNKEDMKELIRKRSQEKLQGIPPPPPKSNSIKIKAKSKTHRVLLAPITDNLHAEAKTSSSAPIPNGPNPPRVIQNADSNRILEDPSRQVLKDANAISSKAATGAVLTSTIQAPNLREIAKQNQQLDAQKAILREINVQLASRVPFNDDNPGNTNPSGFSWERPEARAVRLQDNASSWDWNEGAYAVRSNRK